MIYKKNKILQLSLITISFFLIVYLIFSSHILSFYVPIDILSKENLNQFIYFGDYTYIFRIIDCYDQGYDIYKDNPCVRAYGIKYGSFVYGPMLLSLPKILGSTDHIFVIIFPLLLMAFFLIAVVKTINPKNFITSFIALILIFNPTTLLLLERMNIDIVIFLGLYSLIKIDKKFFLKSIIIFLLSAIKFYPAIFILYFLLEEKLNNKKKVIYFLFNLIIILIYFFFILDEFKSIFAIIENVSRSIKLAFSLNSLVVIINFVFPKLDIFYLKLSMSVLFFILSAFSYYAFKLNKQKIKTDFSKNYFKLFIISYSLTLVLYLLFDNNFYREVYLIFSLPLIYNLYLKKNFFSKIIFFLLIFKYIFMILYTPLFILENLKENIAYQFIITLKLIIDYFLMSFICALFYHFGSQYLLFLKEKYCTTKI
jgi:hypothetical protein